MHHKYWIQLFYTMHIIENDKLSAILYGWTFLFYSLWRIWYSMDVVLQMLSHCFIRQVPLTDHHWNHIHIEMNSFVHALRNIKTTGEEM